jgi:hypothetical protein
MLISIIIPLYDEESVIVEFHRRLVETTGDGYYEWGS